MVSSAPPRPRPQTSGCDLTVYVSRLDTLLFGDMVQPDESAILASVTQKPEDYALQARPLHALPDSGAAYEAIARQSFTERARFACCSFTDEQDSEQSNGSWVGMTITVDDPARQYEPGYKGGIIVTIHSSLIRPICEATPGSLTPAEVSLQRFDVATTVRN